jgi:energy-coupling factor transporter ATP-binding protein EcfA2
VEFVDAHYLDLLQVLKMTAQLSGQVEVVPNNTSEDEDFSYFDILVIGNTGMGKSTLANKLIGIDPDTKELFEAVPKGEHETSVVKRWDIEGDANLYFETGDGTDSVTKACKVLSNENTMNRVLDAPGFTDVGLTYSYGVARGNQQCLRWVLQNQRQHDLRFARVVYFMPQRGIPERVQGTFQEEIKVLHDYFGEKIFNIMVIAVTNHKRKHYQEMAFTEDDLRQTMEVFLAAFKSITGTVLTKCPPIIYLPFDEEYQSVLNRITGADVISDAEKLDFSPEFPINRGDTDQIEVENEKECEKCAILVIMEKSTDGEECEETPVRVRHDNGEEEAREEAYDCSKCHPIFVQKHSRCVKFFGGIGHIGTLGLFVLCSWTWPGFTNNEQVCGNCKRPPRTEGCCLVKQPVEIDGKEHMVNHAV